MKHILLASKGKSTCAAAEEFALAECQRHGATLSVVHVVDYGLEHYGQVDQLATEIDKADFIEYVRAVSIDDARQRFFPLLEKAREKNVRATLYLEDDELIGSLSRHENDADMVIIGGKKSLFFKNTSRFHMISKMLSRPVHHIS